MKGIILACGSGTRLYPVTKATAISADGPPGFGKMTKYLCCLLSGGLCRR